MSSHLALLTAGGAAAKPLPLSEATESLQSINHQLTALQDASEEVLQLQARG